MFEPEQPIAKSHTRFEKERLGKVVGIGLVLFLLVSGAGQGQEETEEPEGPEWLEALEIKEELEASGKFASEVEVVDAWLEALRGRLGREDPLILALDKPLSSASANCSYLFPSPPP